MKFTILLDMDNTLLNNEMGSFLPAYLGALSKYLLPQDPQKIIRELMSATGKMVTNQDPAITLEEAFDARFYPAIGMPKAEIRGKIDQFYAEVFPSIRSVTSPRPQAIALVETLLKQGHRLVVATNPLFPKTAIYQRLGWANLHPDEIPYALVTTYENLHFAKPNPAYYAEIMAQIGWPADPIVMIGDNLEDDLIPAGQLGIPGFLLSSEPVSIETKAHPLSGQGTLDEVLPWLDNLSRETLTIPSAAPAASLAILKSTPAALATLTAKLLPQQWECQPAEGEWCLTEIFCHLRDVDKDVNLPRLQRILDNDNPFLPGANTDGWVSERVYAKIPGLVSLKAFTAARREILSLLTQLTAEQWQRPARHAIFGPTTLAEIVSFTATHDRTHIQQCLVAIR